MHLKLHSKIMNITVGVTDFDLKNLQIWTLFFTQLQWASWLHFGRSCNQDFSMTTEYFLLRFFLEIRYDISL